MKLLKSIILWFVNSVSLLGSADSVLLLGIKHYPNWRERLTFSICMLLLWGYSSLFIIIGLIERERNLKLSDQNEV